MTNKLTPLRIIHCANFSESKNGAVYYAIDRKLSNGLIRNGHFVYDFSYREIARCSNIFKSKKFGIKEVNKSLLETVKNIKPHLLLLGHSELITNDTLLQIKKRFPTIKIAMWWVDPFDKSSHIKNRIDLLDAFFATTGSNYLRKIFPKTDTKLLFFPNVCDSSIEHIKSYGKKDFKYDLIYIGRQDNNRKDFIEKINSIKDIKVGIFGNNKTNLIFGKKYFDIITDSKIALNYSRYNEIELYSSDRIIQLMANGIMTMSPKIPKYDKLFNENEVVYFQDFKDFKEKLDYYLENDEERIKIARNGFLKAHHSFNSVKITQYFIEKIFDIKSDNLYVWER